LFPKKKVFCGGINSKKFRKEGTERKNDERKERKKKRKKEMLTLGFELTTSRFSPQLLTQLDYVANLSRNKNNKYFI
jgi:hypothetical protein